MHAALMPLRHAAIFVVMNGFGDSHRARSVAIGKITGDRSAQVEGAAEKAAGKVQSTLGKAKDAAREKLGK